MTPELRALLSDAWEEGAAAEAAYEQGGPAPVNPYED